VLQFLYIYQLSSEVLSTSLKYSLRVLFKAKTLLGLGLKLFLQLLSGHPYARKHSAKSIQNLNLSFAHLFQR